jgi:hypothetical protein
MRTTQGTPPEDRTSWATFGIGGAALIVGLAALALFLDEPTKERDPTPIDAPTMNEASSTLDAPQGSEQFEHPLSLTKRRVIAQEHARMWNAGAILAGIELIVSAGEPVGPVSFVFGTTVGQPIPGGVLSPDRYIVSFDADAVTTEKKKSASVTIALPDPSCPLDIAFGKLARTADLSGKKLGILYAMSERHGRAIWLVTDSAGQIYNLNGETCALLRN